MMKHTWDGSHIWRKPLLVVEPIKLMRRLRGRSRSRLGLDRVLIEFGHILFGKDIGIVDNLLYECNIVFKRNICRLRCIVKNKFNFPWLCS